MIAAVAGTVGVSVVSALLPVINTVLYIGGLLAANQHVPWPIVGAAAAVGQLLGKTNKPPEGPSHTGNRCQTSASGSSATGHG